MITIVQRVISRCKKVSLLGFQRERMFRHILRLFRHNLGLELKPTHSGTRVKSDLEKKEQQTKRDLTPG